MSKKLHDHLTSTNYANINTKIKTFQKKAQTYKPNTRQDIRA